MNVLFLDIDGVLNSAASEVRTERRQREGKAKVNYHKDEMGSMMEVESCPIAVSNFKYVIEEVPNLKVVVHSNRTKTYGWEVTKKFLTKLGFDTEEWETTPKKLTSEKNHEIGFWLVGYVEKHGKYPKFRVVDDSSWAFNKGDLHVIDPYLGLTLRDAIKLIQYFNPEWEEPVWAL